MSKHIWREKFNQHCISMMGDYEPYYCCGYHWCCNECYCMFEDGCMDCVITIEMILQRNGYRIDYENVTDEYFNMIEDVAESLLEAEDAAKLESAKKVAALDIIKAKKVDVGLFYTLFIEHEDINGGYDEYIESYKVGRTNSYYITEKSKEPLTELEFNLLKEVML